VEGGVGWLVYLGCSSHYQILIPIYKVSRKLYKTLFH
jgi:hypothetical protein